MEFVTEDEPDLTLPEDSIHRARLDELKMRSFDWTDKDGVKQTTTILEWWWRVVATNLGDEYVGRRVKGECPPKLSNRPGNRFREWAEVLLGREIPVGMKLESDDLVGLEADIVIGHQQDKKDKDKVWERVTDISPAIGSSADVPF